MEEVKNLLIKLTTYNSSKIKGTLQNWSSVWVPDKVKMLKVVHDKNLNKIKGSSASQEDISNRTIILKTTEAMDRFIKEKCSYMINCKYPTEIGK